MKSLRSDERGFTVTELLIVLSIISIIASVAAPRWGDSVKDAKARQCAATRHTVDMAEARYVSEKSVEAPSVLALYQGGYLDKPAVCTQGGDYVWATLSLIHI